MQASNLKYKRVLFIRAALTSAWVGAVSPAVGIAYLIEALKKIGVQTHVIDTALGYSPEDITGAITEFKPDLIGISMLTFRYAHLSL